MPVHVRHGAPGSYKSACAVHIDVHGWLMQGREVHTNIRGIGHVSDFEAAYGVEYPPTAKVVAYELTDRESRLQFAKFFHWLPLGAALVIDEGQMIFPDRRDFKETDLDLPDEYNPVNPDTGERDRPSDIYQAIDMHRHYNWDICITTPNIKKLPTWLKGTIEVAYKHDNRSHIPFQKGKCRIIQHSPEESVPRVLKGVPVQTIKVPNHVFSCYGSTTTGTITKSVRRNPLNTPVVWFFGIFICGLAVFFVRSTSQVVGKDSPTLADYSGSAVQAASASVRSGGSGSAVSSDPDYVPTVNAGRSAFDRIVDMIPDQSNGIQIVGFFKMDDRTSYIYRIAQGKTAMIVRSEWLEDSGFVVKVNSECSQDISHPDEPLPYRVTCAAVTDAASEAERASTGAAATSFSLAGS